MGNDVAAWSPSPARPDPGWNPTRADLTVIEGHVTAWLDGGTDRVPLHEYLGWDWADYCLWVTSGHPPGPPALQPSAPGERRDRGAAELPSAT